MLPVTAVLVAAMVAHTSAYSQGAPQLSVDLMMNTICTTGNQRPMHTERGQAILPQSGNAPYQLVVENHHIPYGPGRTLTVTLRALQGKRFKGFFITGDAEDARTGFTGTFQAAPGSPANATMFCVKGITHTDATPKSSVSVQWIAPDNYTHGTIQFKATVVENFKTFYTGVLSQSVAAVQNVDKQTVFAQKQMQKMMNKMMSGGAGGLFGGLNFGDLMKNMKLTQMPQMQLPQMGPMAGLPSSGGPGPTGGSGSTGDMGLGQGGLGFGQGMGQGMGQGGSDGGLASMGNFFQQFQG